MVYLNYLPMKNQRDFSAKRETPQRGFITFFILVMFLAAVAVDYVLTHPNFNLADLNPLKTPTPAPISELTGTLKGRVVDSNTSPMSDADVVASCECLVQARLKADELKPDRGGSFEVHNLPPGEYTFKAILQSDYQRSSDPIKVDIKGGQTSSIVLIIP